MAFFLPHFQNAFETFPNCKTSLMVVLYSEPAFQIYKFYQIWSWDDTPINCFTKCSINGHYHALNQNTNKIFQQTRTKGMLSLYFP